MSHPQSEHDDPLTAVVFDIVDQVERDLERGEQFPLEHYLDRFPGHDDLVRREVERVRQQRAAQVPTDESPVGRRLGPYEILRELGRGGQGAVYLARDSRLKREVALKVLPPSAFVSATRLQRFRREADVVASLSHPAICDVIDADFGGDVAYIAMRFVPGRALADALRNGDAQGRRGIRGSIVTIERIARAVHVAHEAGVVHRDIKPDNIIVTPEGDPVLLDFGLAKGVDDATLTEPGAAFGTLHYMAPEQLLERPPPIDRRADVYALAATLFELVTGRRPFEAETREGLVTVIRTVPPADAHTLNPDVPSDLPVVLAKALEKDPRRRYASALDLADDLRRVVAYEPIVARPASTMVRVSRWAQRHPLISTSVTLSTLLLTAGLIVSLVLLDRVRAERERHRALSLATYAHTLVAQDPTFALLTAIEASHIERSQTANTALYQALLAGHEERAIGLDRMYAAGMVAVAPASGRLAFAAGRSCRVQALDGEEHRIDCAATVLHEAFDPAERSLAVGCEDGGAFVFDAATGATVATIPPHQGPVTRVAFSHDGRHVVTCSDDGTSRVLDLASGRATGPFGRGSASTWRATVDAETVVVLDRDGVLSAFAHATGESRWTIADAGTIRVLEAADDGRHIGFATETEVIVAETATGNVVQRWRSEQVLQCLAFDHASRRLAVGHVGGFRIWNVGDGALLVERETHARRTVWDVAFSPHGERLATTGVDGTARVFDATSGDPLAVLPMTEPHVTHAYWTPDGKRVIVVCRDNAISINCLEDRRGLLTLRGHQGAVRTAHFATDGRTVLTASDDGTARVFDQDGAVLSTFQHDTAVTDALWSPDGERVLTLAADGVHVFSCADPARGRHLVGGSCVAALWLARDSVVTVMADGEVAVRDAASGRVLRQTRVARAVRCAALLAEPPRVALGHDTPHVSIVPLEGTEPPATLALTSRHAKVPNPAVLNIAGVPGRALLLAGVEDVQLRVIGLDPLRVLHRLPVSTPAFTVTDRRGTLALTGAAYNPRAFLIALGAGAARRVAIHADHGNCLTHGAFSPDDRLFVTASFDGTARLYHSDASGAYAVLSGHTDVVTHAEFSADGSQLVTTSLDHTARIWPTDPLPLAMRRKPRDLTTLELNALESRGSPVR